jgi:tetratricopeptide (TPR) repeat protein
MDEREEQRMMATDDPPFDPDLISQSMLGVKMSGWSAKRLEAHLKGNPDDHYARARLLAYYEMRGLFSKRKRQAKARHVLWVIQNRPESDLASNPECHLSSVWDHESYEEAKRLWMEQVERHPSNPLIIHNAAEFFQFEDRPQAELLYLRLLDLKPDVASWRERVASFYELMARWPFEEDDGNVSRYRQQAFFHREEAYRLTDEEYERIRRLQSLPSAAFEAGELDKAEAYARQLLDLEGASPEIRYFKSDAAHTAQSTLGRVALKRGNTDEAKRWLMLSAQSTNLTFVSNIDSSIKLAKDMLEQGERQAVLDYLQLCKRLGPGDQAEEWRREIQRTGKCQWKGSGWLEVFTGIQMFFDFIRGKFPG